MVKVILRKKAEIMSKKENNRILDENGQLVPFPSTLVAQTIHYGQISNEALASHKEAIEEMHEDLELKHVRAVDKKKNDQVKKKEEAAHKKILEAKAQ